MPSSLLAFIGGGNMASAVIGGLVASGRAADSILVVDPGEAQRTSLQTRFGVRALAAADASLAEATLVVWAVKPQLFHAAAAPCQPWVGQALHLSVMAGIRSGTIAAAVGTERVVRAMPNTPALIGQGISGLFARAAVRTEERTQVEAVLAPTGRLLWLAREDALDAVTALSGSGPAYVFYVIEAMLIAAEQMGLSATEGRALALATVAGATALAQASDDAPGLLRERVTSKGGTTAAAIEVLDAAGVQSAFIAAMRAAERRAGELGDTFAG
jgi:pyrroline-5-carboxylate reductase